MKQILKDLIKASKDFIEYKSIGNGAKLNIAIEKAELKLSEPTKKVNASEGKFAISDVSGSFTAKDMHEQYKKGLKEGMELADEIK